MQQNTQVKGAAIVTGASGGIGKGIAERLAADGFAVVAHYAGSAEKAEEAVKNIKAAGGRAVAVKADISSAAEVKQLFETASSAYGDIGAVVNSAGIMPLAPIAAGDIDAFAARRHAHPGRPVNAVEGETRHRVRFVHGGVQRHRQDRHV